MAIELEAKLELQREVYLELLTMGVVRHEIEQLNVYYDFKWILAGRGATFRIRFARGHGPVCTLKIPIATDREGVRVANEVETPLRDATVESGHALTPAKFMTVRDLAPQYRDVLRRVNIERLVRVG